jgi:hypothetical protein
MKNSLFKIILCIIAICIIGFIGYIMLKTYLPYAIEEWGNYIESK